MKNLSGNIVYNTDDKVKSYINSEMQIMNELFSSLVHDTDNLALKETKFE